MSNPAMRDEQGPGFALYYAGDAYSTDRKIMGRQSAGKALMKGVARRWPEGVVHGFGTGRAAGEAMLRQLKSFGFGGTVRWREAPGDEPLKSLGAVYYPAPPTRELAHARNTLGPAAYSLIGVTHTLSSAGAMDQVAAPVLAPFQRWDALICTSSAAAEVVRRLQDELRRWCAEHLGATRFNEPMLPLIPLGVDAPAFAAAGADRDASRSRLRLAADETAFLFAGRLTFHAKANPAPFYLALQGACERSGRRLVCIEAGIYPNEGTCRAYAEARAKLAPGARFIWVDGADEPAYRHAWSAADVFVSLSDNVQETFGLTPLEAMAAGLPVLVSDWDGYKDTVRDGVDGYRVPVIMPEPGAGRALAARHALGQDTYDQYIGNVSMATAVDVPALTRRILILAQTPALRRSQGAAGRARAQQSYDWPIILDRYDVLARELGGIRRRAGQPAPLSWPGRPDPFALFSHFPTRIARNDCKVSSRPGREAAVREAASLGVTRYVTGAALPEETILEAYRQAVRGGTVASIVAACGPDAEAGRRALMWLNKLALIDLAP